MPLRHLGALARAGRGAEPTVAVRRRLPEDVPGLGALRIGDRAARALCRAGAGRGAGPGACTPGGWGAGASCWRPMPARRWRLRASGASRWPTWACRCCAGRRRRAIGRASVLPGQPRRASVRGMGAAGHPAAAGLVMDALSGEVGLGTLRPAAAGGHGDFLAWRRASRCWCGRSPALPAGPLRGGGGLPHRRGRPCRDPGRSVSCAAVRRCPRPFAGEDPCPGAAWPTPACARFRAPPSTAPSSTCRPPPARRGPGTRARRRPRGGGGAPERPGGRHAVGAAVPARRPPPPAPRQQHPGDRGVAACPPTASPRRPARAPPASATTTSTSSTSATAPSIPPDGRRFPRASLDRSCCALSRRGSGVGALLRIPDESADLPPIAPGSWHGE